MSDDGKPPTRKRRDPRSERRARKEPPASPAAAAPTRGRRDPREARERRKKRPGDAAATPSSEVSPIVIDRPTKLIGVVPDLPDGRPNEHDRDAIAVAAHLAREGGAVVAVLFDSPAVPLGAFPVDRVVRLDDPAYSGYAPEARAQAVAALIEALPLQHVVLPDSEGGGGDLGRRIAARRGVRAATNARQVDANQTVRRARAGTLDVSMATPEVILIAPEAAELELGAPHEARPLGAPAIAARGRIEDRGPLALDPDAVALEEAELIVCGGNGMRDWEAFARLCRALGATRAGSRVACDAGHLERDRQVGASGRLVRARLYLALGISGAPQHLQGIEGCERVVSINTDPECAMGRRADLSVVGDLDAIVPELIALAEAGA